MPWAAVDDQFPDQPEVLRAGPEAGWLWLCGRCYCARMLTDGFIPKEAIPTLSTLRQPARIAVRLVDAGVWADRGSAYEDIEYLAANPSKEEVEQRREAARLRQKSRRDRRRDKPRDSHPPPTPVSEPNGSEAKPRPRNPHFDALTEVFGPTSTRGEGQLYGTVAASLRAAGAAPDEIVTRGKRMLARGWDNPGPKALDNHWSELAYDKPSNGTRPADPTDDAPGAHHCEACGELDFLPGTGHMECACSRDELLRRRG